MKNQFISSKNPPITRPSTQAPAKMLLKEKKELLEKLAQSLLYLMPGIKLVILVGIALDFDIPLDHPRISEKQSLRALEKQLVDAVAGLTPIDERVAERLRKKTSSWQWSSAAGSTMVEHLVISQ